jgi:hypothetical protein
MVLITSIRFNKNFLTQTCKRRAFALPITAELFSTGKEIEHVEGFGQIKVGFYLFLRPGLAVTI